MSVGDRQNSDSVIEHQISDVEREARDGRSPNLEVRRTVLDARTGPGPFGDQTDGLVDRFQELLRLGGELDGQQANSGDGGWSGAAGSWP